MLILSALMVSLLTDLWSAIDPKYLDYTQEINKTVIAFKIFPISSDLIAIQT